MKRDEHLAWCKKRAHEYADEGDFTNAVTSMLSDINKHEGTAMHGPMAGVLMMTAMNGPQTTHDIKRWIDGFN